MTVVTDRIQGSADKLFAELCRRYREERIEAVTGSGARQSVFVSYGSPDERIAQHINQNLVRRGVKTWFFPDDKLPRELLHRVMRMGIITHDRVLLICSKSSLSRPGVLSELDSVLVREANQGGASILIPVSIDDYVFTDWKPRNEDLAWAVRARVITKLPSAEIDPHGFTRAMSRVRDALAVRRTVDLSALA